MRCTRGMKLMALVALAAAGCKRGEAPAQERTHGASPVDAGEARVPALRRPESRPAPADAGAAVRPPTLPPARGAGTSADGGAVPAGGPGAPEAAAVPTSAADARTADAGSAAARAAAGTTDADGASARGATDAGSAPARTGDAGADTWTAGVVKRERSGGGPGSVTLTAVRSARQEGFDRVVFEFAGDALPGYHLEYVDRPIIRCGSGEPTEVAGQGWLQVRLTGAQAHTEQGKPTVAPRERKLQLGVLRELEHTCDFEGEVTWVLGLQKPNRFRVLELKAPTRLVVDVRH
jgi:hypothetical protein